MAPAIDVDRFARHIRCIDEEEEHRPGDIFGRAFALEWRMRDDPLTRELVERFVVRPQDRPGRDGVDPDLGGELTGE